MLSYKILYKFTNKRMMENKLAERSVIRCGNALRMKTSLISGSTVAFDKFERASNRT